MCSGGLHSLSALGYSGGRFCSLQCCPALFSLVEGFPVVAQVPLSLLYAVVGVRWLMVSFFRRWLDWGEPRYGCCATDAPEADTTPQNSQE